MVAGFLEPKLDSCLRNRRCHEGFAGFHDAALYDGGFFARRAPDEIQRRSVYRRARHAGKRGINPEGSRSRFSGMGKLLLESEQSVALLAARADGRFRFAQTMV